MRQEAVLGAATGKPERLISMADASERLSLSIWTLRGWAYAGKVASCKLGSRLLIPESEVDRLINESLRPAVSTGK
jgi:excisionase family DNA binding protein